MKTKNYFFSLSRKFVKLLFLQFSLLAVAQNIPEVSRLIQQNTLKGSRLLLVETTDSFSYHLGTINSSEVGVDNLSAYNVGLDDLFILKSNVANGGNVWFKTFNAASNGTVTPRYVYVDPSENVYIFAQFKGSVTVAGKTINSVNSTDAFLMKLDSNGNALWINYLENAYDSLAKFKCVSDASDVFFVYGTNHLAKFSAATGNLVYDNVYNGLQLKSVAIDAENLYVAGSTTGSGVAFGTEFFPDIYSGFVLKGDKNGNFSQSLRTKNAGNSYGFSDISDISISSDGFLLLSGFYTSSNLNLITESKTVSFTFNPNSGNLNTRLFNFVAKTDLSLNDASFFRSSTAIITDGGTPVSLNRNFSKIIPEHNGNGFRHLLFINDRFKNITSYTNTNGTITAVPANSGTDYTLITLNDASGLPKTGNQSINFGLKSASSTNYFLQATSNLKLFSSGLYNFQNTNPLWSKEKQSYLGGGFYQTTIKHLKSENGDIFLTSLVEGKANFFGKNVANNNGSYSRYITRLGSDGLAKWIANVDYSLLTEYTKYNVSQNFAVVDSQDNLYVLMNVSNNVTPKLTDALGTTVTFSQNNFADWRVLIKLDKNGKYLWSKEISGSNIAGLLLDQSDNLYLTGTCGNILVNGTDYNNSGINSYYIFKFQANGNLAYSKVYQTNASAFSVNTALDNANNLYLFSEPINNSGSSYLFGNVSIPTNETHTDLLMVKFDTNGNAVFGKNFYANAMDIRYSWPNDIKFDGSNFILMGNYYGDSSSTAFSGLDLAEIPRVYNNSSPYVPFIAKVSTSGNVVWQKAIDSNNSNTGNYTNIDLDETGNIYMYYYVKDKMSYNGTEYSFDKIKGNKVLLKIGNNGNLNYLKNVDLGTSSSYPMVDVISNDKINLSAYTLENNVLNYPIRNANAFNMYVATLGSINQKYLTPRKNYLQLTKIDLLNDSKNLNSFDFELANNVNWSATTDQSWLTLSSIKLGGKKGTQNTVSGQGDAVINVTATTNASGADRSATIIITGDSGVSSKTIIVTQSGIMNTSEISLKTIVLYPNPTSDILNIETDQIIDKIEIYDAGGRLVKKKEGRVASVDVSELSDGVYYVKIFTSQTIINTKFLKN